MITISNFIAGVSSWFEVVRSHRHRLIFNFSAHLETFAAKFSAVGLIDIDSLTNACNTKQPEGDRAKALLDDILGKIESEKKWFDTLVSVMRKIPELGPLADELEMAQKLEEDRSTREVLVIRPAPPQGCLTAYYKY